MKAEELRRARMLIPSATPGLHGGMIRQTSHEVLERVLDHLIEEAEHVEGAGAVFIPARPLIDGDDARELLGQLFVKPPTDATLATEVHAKVEALRRERDEWTRRYDAANDALLESNRLRAAEASKLDEARESVHEWKRAEASNRAEVARLSTALEVVTSAVNRVDTVLTDADYDDADGDGGTLDLGSRVANVIHDLEEARGQLKQRHPDPNAAMCPHGTPVADWCMACEDVG
jgi:hypothetical protein